MKIDKIEITKQIVSFAANRAQRSTLDDRDNNVEQNNLLRTLFKEHNITEQDFLIANNIFKSDYSESGPGYKINHYTLGENKVVFKNGEISINEWPDNSEPKLKIDEKHSLMFNMRFPSREYVENYNKIFGKKGRTMGEGGEV